jgi:hypothetical protein
MGVATQMDSLSVLRSFLSRASIDGRLTDEDAEEHHGHHLARLAQDLRRRGRVTAVLHSRMQTCTSAADGIPSDKENNKYQRRRGAIRGARQLSEQGARARWCDDHHEIDMIERGEKLAGRPGSDS